TFSFSLAIIPLFEKPWFILVILFHYLLLHLGQYLKHFLNLVQEKTDRILTSRFFTGVYSFINRLIRDAILFD
ncbi:virulence factor MviN, partial [Streptococcus sanguinis]